MLNASNVPSPPIDLAAVRDRERSAASEGPRPLMRPLEVADEYPVEALGSTLAAAVVAIHERTRAPMAIAAQSVLGAVNLGTQPHADVELPNGQVSPTSLYLLSVADSGDRKSSADKEALKPIRRHQDNLRDRYEVAKIDYDINKVAWETAQASIKKTQGKAGREAIRKALMELGPEPAPPPFPGMVYSEPTIEGMAKALMNSLPTLGIFSTEGGQFIGGHAWSPEARLRSSTALSKLWDGADLDRVRSGEGITVIRGKRVALHLMLQPGVADLLLADETMSDQGLLSRMLVTAPTSLAGSRFWAETPASADVALRTYDGRVLQILERPLPYAPGRESFRELAPRVLRLTDESRALWIKFADFVEAQLGEGGKLAPVKSRANKSAELAARIAATLAVFDDVEAGYIHAEHMQRGIVLVQHYIAEALRLSNVARVGVDLRTAQTVLNWLHSDWASDLVSLPDCYQRGPARISTQAAAIASVKILEEHGWLERVKGGAVVHGYRRKDVWRVVREVVS